MRSFRILEVVVGGTALVLVVLAVDELVGRNPPALAIDAVALASVVTVVWLSGCGSDRWR